jgi:hypothetical protein
VSTCQLRDNTQLLATHHKGSKTGGDLLMRPYERSIASIFPAAFIIHEMVLL